MTEHRPALAGLLAAADRIGAATIPFGVDDVCVQLASDVDLEMKPSDLIGEGDRWDITVIIRPQTLAADRVGEHITLVLRRIAFLASGEHRGLGWTAQGRTPTGRCTLSIYGWRRGSHVRHQVELPGTNARLVRGAVDRFIAGVDAGGTAGDWGQQ